MARPTGKSATLATEGLKAAERQIVNYTEDLGRFLGRVRANVSNWNLERQRLVKDLTGVIDAAEQLLSQLGREAGEGVRRRVRRAGNARTAGLRVVSRTARTVTDVARTAGKKQRRVSAAVRRKMAIARKKWWAARKAAAKKIGG